MAVYSVADRSCGSRLVMSVISGLFVVVVSTARADLFVDVAAERGVSPTGQTFGASWGDVDQDGRPDLWLGNGDAPPLLLLNAEDGFVASDLLVNEQQVEMFGASWADADNDGDADLFVTAGALGGSGSQPNQLFLNNAGALTEQAAVVGLDYPLGRGRHATWTDWNLDGYLDLVVINNNRRDAEPHNPSAVFTFDPASGTYLAESWTINSKRTTEFAQNVFSNDAAPGQSVVLVAHDKTDFPDGVLAFDSLGPTDLRPTFAFPSIDNVLDVAVADFDNDLSTDFFTVSRTEGRVLLQRAAGINDGTPGAGLGQINNAQYVVAGDFDNDKDIDIYVARTDLAQGSNVSNQFYSNAGDGSFVLHPTAHGAQGTTQGGVSSLTVVDYNGDGFLDLFVTNSENAAVGPAQLFENQGNGNHWITLKLQGTVSNRDAIGAVVKVTSGGTTQLREVHGGVHRRSQDESLLHFGLGSDDVVDLIEISWPSGIVQTISAIEINQQLSVVEAAADSPNAAPTAALSLESLAGTLNVVASAEGSFDVDGAVVAHQWEFGDGSTATGLEVTHSYAIQGEYTVTLTVTDDRGAVDVVTGSVLVQLDAGVVAVGSNSESAEALIDQTADRQPDLSTFWSNTSDPGASWFTIDLGSPRPVESVELALRGDVPQVVDIFLGNLLDSGQVPGFAASVCTFPGTDQREPSEFTSCAVAPQLARYVTVAARTNNLFEVYGVTVVESAVLAGSLTQVGFSAVPGQGNVSLSVSDEKPGVSYSWDFGDGNGASGPTAAHSYANPGSYRVTLTAVSVGGSSLSVGASVVISSGTDQGLLPLAVVAVGGSSATQGNLVDALGDGSQNLSTRWLNANNQNSSAWFTLDLGSTVQLDEVRLAPKGNVKYTLDLFIGDTLDGGRVAADPVSTCIIPSSGSSVPSALTSCPLPFNQGRYITVAETLRSKLLMYGVEAVGSSVAETSDVPDVQFSAQQLANTLSVMFDGSASVDPEGQAVSYVWEYGDSEVGAGETTTHVYSAGAEYFASLAVTDATSNVAVLGQSVPVIGLPGLPQFIVQPAAVTVIAGQSTVLSAEVDGQSPLSLQWLVDGSAVPGATGLSLALQNLQVADSGRVYSLRATNPAGSTLSQDAPVTVLPDNVAPVASFSFDPTGGFNPVAINFDAASSADSDGDIVSFAWDFGDGNAASGEQVSHTFLGAGDFEVSLVVTDDDGATATVMQTVSVEQSSEVVITSQPQSVSSLVGESVSFNVVVSSTPPISYQWKKDGQDIPGATAAVLTVDNVTLADDGASYTVSVANAASTVVSDVASLAVNALPVPAFTLNAELGTLPFTLAVDAGASTDNGSIVSYAWDFGDGSSGSGVTANHDYTESGDYVVALTVTDDRGASATLTQSVIVNDAPTAAFTADPLVHLVQSTVSFDAAGSADPDGTIVEYLWDFGDGASASGSTTTHSYSTAGEYTIVLTVTDNRGATATASQTVYANDAPVALFTADPLTGLVGSTVNFDAAGSTDADGEIVAYAWDFGDGSTASGVAATHSYAAAGEFVATLTVTDDRGAEASFSATIIANAAPVALIAADPLAGLVETPVTFDATGSSDADGSIAEYAWSFGDGSSATGATVSHSYTSAGSYTASLLVTDNFGATDAATISLIANDAPTAVIQGAPPPTVIPTTVSLNATASADAVGGIASLSWDLGDGTTATTELVSHTYSEAGTYTVTLTVTDVYGVSTTSSAQIVALPPVPPVFSQQPASLSVVEGDPVVFTAAVTGTAPFGYQWLRNGQVLPGANAAAYAIPAAALTDDGASYSLRVSNAAATVVSEPALLSVTPLNIAPTASFTAGQLGNSLSVAFDGTSSSDSDGEIVSYAWMFGDGQTSTAVAPVHTYADEGQYTAVLTVVDDAGTSSSSSQTVDVQIVVPDTAVAAAGANEGSAGLAIDRTEDAQLNLSTFWVNDHTKATAWITLDLGATQTVGELLLAPRADREYVFDVFVGDVLEGGKVPGFADATCTTPDLGNGTPTELQQCNFASVQGRYVTLSSKLVASLRLHGIEVGNGVGNMAPIADFAVAPVAGSESAFSFDAAASSDADGQIVLYSWTFGDGASATGQTSQHEYAGTGNYSVVLTVTDDAGESATAEMTVSVGNPPALASVPLLALDAGSRASNRARASDEQESGAQNFATHWTSGSNIANSWITFDMGATQQLAELNLTPRRDRAYTLDVFVGDSLTNGRVSGAPSGTCVSANIGLARPTELFGCDIGLHEGRYVTVASRDSGAFRLFAAEAKVVTEPSGDPIAEFTLQPDAVDPFSILFDASTSSDPDGSLVGYSWDFGDGAMGTGQVITHVYAASGNYAVSLTVTDNDGLTSTVSQMVFAGVPPSDVPVSATVSSAGFNLNLAGRIVDENANGQDLATFWKDGGRLNKSWFTLDLGSERDVTQLHLAPRNDRAYVLEITIGSALTGTGEVSAPATTTCAFEAGASLAPSALTACAGAQGVGRYITVRNLSGTPLRMYGAQVWATP